jgi:hypothetical protein
MLTGGAVPYDVISELFTSVTTNTQLQTCIDKYFKPVDQTDTLETFEYNNMYIKYLPVLTVNGIYNISDSQSVIGFRMINKKVLKSITDSIKHKKHRDLFSDTSDAIIYEFINGKDLVQDAINMDDEIVADD